MRGAVLCAARGAESKAPPPPPPPLLLPLPVSLLYTHFLAWAERGEGRYRTEEGGGAVGDEAHQHLDACAGVKVSE